MKSRSVFLRIRMHEIEKVCVLDLNFVDSLFFRWNNLELRGFFVGGNEQPCHFFFVDQQIFMSVEKSE